MAAKHQRRTTFANISGATSATLSLTPQPLPRTATSTARYSQTASGTATTTAATLTVNSAPAITTNPANTTVIAGATATFTAAASGMPTPTVQWQVSTNGGTTFTNITGATSTTLSFTAAAAENGNQYRAVFTNSVGSATTTAATLTVDFAPTVTTNPVSSSVTAGATATFTAAASGNPTPTVQWQQSTDGVNVHEYLRCNIHNAFVYRSGRAERQPIPRGIHQQREHRDHHRRDVDGELCSSDHHQSGEHQRGRRSDRDIHRRGQRHPTPTVQWQQSTDGVTFTNISGATSATLSFVAAATQNGNQYRAVFTNSVGSATTTGATLDRELRTGDHHQPGEHHGERRSNSNVHRRGQRNADPDRAVADKHERRNVYEYLGSNLGNVVNLAVTAVKTATNTAPCSRTASARQPAQPRH